MRRMSANVVVGLSWRGPSRTRRAVARLASYLDVPIEDVTVTEGRTTALLHVAQPQQPYDHDWCHVDARSQTASAHPIRVEALLAAQDVERRPDERGPAALRGFYDRYADADLAFYEVPPPLCLMRHDIEADRVTAFTDAMGFGRLYHVEGTDFTVTSSDALVAALLADRPASLADGYWDAFFVWGHGQGATSSVAGVQRAGSGARVRLGPEAGIDVRRLYGEDILFARLRRGELSVDPQLPATREQLRLAYANSRSKLTLGLSGGQDSRFVAAAAIAEGYRVRRAHFRSARDRGRGGRDAPRRRPRGSPSRLENDEVQVRHPRT